MSALADRSATALLVVDVQVDAVQAAWQREETIARIGSLGEAARRGGVTVVWIRHSDDWLPEGSDGRQIVSELSPIPGEAIVGKHFGDSFEATNLDETLAVEEVGHIVVCGVQSDACIIPTLYGGFVRGYDVTLVRNAHTTADRSKQGGVDPDAVIRTVNRIWAGREAHDRRVQTLTAVAVIDQILVR